MENATLKLNRGDDAPEFSLKQAGGDNFSLVASLEQGSSVLLVFTHGQDCAVCSKQLVEFQENLAKFEDRGMRVVAITPKPDDFNLELKENLKITFPVLSDDGTVADRYGVVAEGEINPTEIIVDYHGTISWIYTGQCGDTPDWPTLEYIWRHMVIARGV
jgi:thioredoxin-dependent peroxiredoxin